MHWFQVLRARNEYVSFLSLVEVSLMIHAEVVLVELLEGMRFSPSDKNILWNMPGVAHPVVADGSGLEKAQLPIKVELVK